MDLTSRMVLEVASHEALVRQAYRDSVGKWTWSFGLTSATGHNVERYIDNPQSLQKCIAVYVWALDNYADHVRRRFQGLSEEQFAAVSSFTWNLGAGRLDEASWVDFFKRGEMEEAERRWKTWNKANGRVSSGLVARRKKECDLFFRGKWSHGPTVTEITRLTANKQPVFSSGKQIDIRLAVVEELRRRSGVEVDQPPRPDSPVEEPTLTPEVNELLTTILAALAMITGAIVTYMGSE